MIIRENYLRKIRPFYDLDIIKILVGIRRCGKSVILKQIIEELKKTKNIDDAHIISINFESIEYRNLLNYEDLYYYIKSKINDSKIYYIFFDEIQVVENFELGINSLRANFSNVSIFLTGSNSKLLSDELSSVLSGRYVAFKIYPLSYKEYIELTKKEARDITSFNDFATWGGLPYRCNLTDEESLRNYLHSVCDSIVLRDVIMNLNLRDATLFSLLLNYILEINGREFSIDNVINYLKNENHNVSNETIYSYINAMCKALIISKVYRYDVNGKMVLKTLNKYYATDLGIANIQTTKTKFKTYIALENIVYNELLIKGYEVYVGKSKKGEIDFVSKKNGVIKYIQVAYLIGENEETFNREFNAFNYIEDNYPRYVISLDPIDLSYNGIKHLNLFDFLLNDDF